MKKILTLLFVLVAASGTANASSYLTIAENDTLRISPNCLNNTVTVPVLANFDGGVADHWRLEVTHQTNLDLIGKGYSASFYGMHIPYLQSDGTAAIYDAILTTIHDEFYIDAFTRQTIVESSTTVFGYWDYNNDGIYEPYGLVKWGPGHYDRMFDFYFNVQADCTGDTIVIDGQMSSTTDWRYPTLTAQFHQVIYLKVAYLLGDVTGDESVNMYDVTVLIDYLTHGVPALNQYQLDAADVNRDGVVDIKDCAALIDILLGVGTNEAEDFSDM